MKNCENCARGFASGAKGEKENDDEEDRNEEVSVKYGIPLEPFFSKCGKFSQRDADSSGGVSGERAMSTDEWRESKAHTRESKATSARE